MIPKQDLSDEELRKRARKLAKMLRQVINIKLYKDHCKLLEMQIEKLEQARDNGEAIDPDQVCVLCIYNRFSIKCPP